MKRRWTDPHPIDVYGLPGLTKTVLGAFLWGQPFRDCYEDEILRLVQLFVKISTLIFLIVFKSASSLADIPAFVDIEPGAFNPSEVTINVNDSVVWTWVSGRITTRTALTDCGILDFFNTGHVFTNTFTTAGIFAYICQGSRFWRNRNCSSSCAHRLHHSPTNGASFTAPPMFHHRHRQRFGWQRHQRGVLRWGTLLGGTNNTPYTITASLATGGHPLTAVATDNLGLSTTSGVVNVTVSAANVPPSVTITNPADAVFGSSAAVTIRASANDTDGSVTNVQFFDGAVLLRSVSTAHTLLPPAWRSARIR